MISAVLIAIILLIFIARDKIIDYYRPPIVCPTCDRTDCPTIPQPDPWLVLPTEVLNATTGATAAMSNQDPRFPASNSIDGKYGGFCHSDLPSDLHWLQIDVQKDRKIKHIRVNNRFDCCQERLASGKISIIDESGAIVFSQMLGEVKYWYDFDPRVTGRYIKIELTQPNDLNLDEIVITALK